MQTRVSVDIDEEVKGGPIKVALMIFSDDGSAYTCMILTCEEARQLQLKITGLLHEISER